MAVLTKNRSGTAPQVGRGYEQAIDKLKYWEELDEVLQPIPDKEGLVVIGDFNGHVGMERPCLERLNGGNNYGILNDEVRPALQCAQMYDLSICNTFFQKKEEHNIAVGHDGQPLIISSYEDRV